MKLWRRDLKIATDFPRQELIDLTVPRYSRDLSRDLIDVERVACSFTQEDALIPGQMAHEVDAPHAAEMRSGSRITSAPARSSSASRRLASRTIRTASWRFARASCKRRALGVGARELLDEADVAFRHRAEHGRKLVLHVVPPAHRSITGKCRLGRAPCLPVAAGPAQRSVAQRWEASPQCILCPFDDCSHAHSSVRSQGGGRRNGALSDHGRGWLSRLAPDRSPARPPAMRSSSSTT